MRVSYTQPAFGKVQHTLERCISHAQLTICACKLHTRARARVQSKPEAQQAMGMGLDNPLGASMFQKYELSSHSGPVAQGGRESTSLRPTATREDSTIANPASSRLLTVLIVVVPEILHVLARVRLPGSTQSETTRLISCVLLVFDFGIPIAVPYRDTLAIITPVSGHSGRFDEPCLTD